MRPWILACLGLAALACTQPPSEPAPPEDAALEPIAEASDGESRPDIYEVRGEIVGLPVEGDPQSDLRIKHEAIDDLKGIGGEVWGMGAMTMPFEVAEDVSLDGLAVGDKVRFTLAVDWLGERPQEITAIEELPADTELEFREARPAEARPAEARPAEVRPAEDEGS